MPRTGGGTGPFVLNPVYLAVPGTTILATQHNTPLEDIEDTFNIPQPIAYGGTQAASAIEAMDNLFIVGADKASSASIDLDNVTGSFVNITGTTPVTSIALAEGAIRFARAVAALPLTASASLIVNGSTTQAYTCEAGDQMMIVGYAGAIVRIWVTGRNKFIASQFKIADGTDQTKQVQFSASGLPTATTRTLDAPYYSGTLGLVSDIRGYIYGLTLTNDAGDLTNDIAFAAGSAVDSTGTASMLLAVGLIKRVDATWTSGTNQGGRFYTTLVDGTIYEYVIRNPTTGVVDCGFSDNATNPTGGASYPAGFTQYARVGSNARVAGVNKAPRSLSQDVTDWVGYTPTFTGFGTVTTPVFQSRRIGDTLEVQGTFISGTSTGVEARITLGFDGMDGNVVSAPSNKIPPRVIAGPAGVNANVAASFNSLVEPSAGFLQIGIQSSTTAAYNPANGSALVASGTALTLRATIPVAGW